MSEFPRDARHREAFDTIRLEMARERMQAQRSGSLAAWYSKLRTEALTHMVNIGVDPAVVGSDLDSYLEEAESAEAALEGIVFLQRYALLTGDMMDFQYDLLIPDTDHA